MSLRHGQLAHLAALLTAVFVVVVPSVALAVPDFVRLSIGQDGATSMSVTWNTAASGATEVRYGTRPGELTETVAATESRGPGELNYIHQVLLEGLAPATTYYYVVGSLSAGFSEERSFTTGPVPDADCGSFVFGFIGDNRPDPTFGGGDNYPEVLGQLAEHGPAFVLNGGDMVVDGDQVDQWVDFLDWTEEAGRDVPHMPTIGNHDDGPGEGDGAVYNQVWTLPRSEGDDGSGTEDYYFFTYGNAIFVSVSTDTFTGGATPFANQAAWLDRVLTENPRRWKIVFMHKPIYTHEVVFSISHEPNEEQQNAAFVDVFDRHHVDLVLTSHNHWYERYEPSACGTDGQPGSAEPCSVGATNYGDGTVNIVSGGAGAFTIPAALCGGGFLDPVDARVTCDDPHHYLLMEIDHGTLRYEAHDTDAGGAVFDAFTITKGGVECAVVTEDAGDDAADGPDVGPEPDIGAPDTETADTETSDTQSADTAEPDAPEPDVGGESESEDDAPGSGEGSGDGDASDGPRTPPATDSSGGGCSCTSMRSHRPGPTPLVFASLLVLGWARTRRGGPEPRGG